MYNYMCIRKQNEYMYDLMMIYLVKQDGTFVHNYHCTFYNTVVDGYMYMYMYVHVPTQYIYTCTCILYTQYMYVYIYIYILYVLLLVMGVSE